MPSAATRAAGEAPPDTVPLPADRTDCWAAPMPLHRARLEGEAAEDHILRGLD